MMLEQKQEKLLAAVEAAGYRLAKEESNSQHLQFIPDGTHRMQGHLFAKSWNEVERWVEAIIEKGDPIQKERVERVIYPERFEQSFEEMMFTNLYNPKGTVIIEFKTSLCKGTNSESIRNNSNST